MNVISDLSSGVTEAKQINIYIEGSLLECNPGEKLYCDIVTSWIDMTKDAHILPAFGVSLDRETRKAINSGVWVEFVFGKEYNYNEMPFENLLINIQKDFHGFNIIRYTSEYGYDGRCFYLDILDKDMSKLYGILSDL